MWEVRYFPILKKDNCAYITCKRTLETFQKKPYKSSFINTPIAHLPI